MVWSRVDLVLYEVDHEEKKAVRPKDLQLLSLPRGTDGHVTRIAHVVGG